MFSYASAIVAVSTTMVEMLVALGAPRDRVHYNPYGVDLERFEGGTPASAPPRFLAVGRFVAKKAPDLTLRAFAQVRASFPDATLRMIGGGQLLEASRQLAEELGVAPAVTFSGFEGDDAVRAAMREARCFVQHSVVAPNGDMEGTPVAILEASASALPVVATRHAGIRDAVREGETGWLVDEGDVDGMTAHMLRLARHPEEAARLGAAGREWIREHFDARKRLAGLRRIIASAIVAAPV
jgi:glycosyltransferase involved in cell wall biosynthesis